MEYKERLEIILKQIDYIIAEEDKRFKLEIKKRLNESKSIEQDTEIIKEMAGREACIYIGNLKLMREAVFELLEEKRKH